MHKVETQGLVCLAGFCISEVGALAHKHEGLDVVGFEFPEGRAKALEGHLRVTPKSDDYDIGRVQSRCPSCGPNYKMIRTSLRMKETYRDL